MLEGEQARVRQQLREEVEKAGNGLVSIQQGLKELRNKREKWPELEPGAEIAAPPSETRIKEAGAMYRRQEKVYVKFHRAYQEVKRCFDIAAAISRDFALLKDEFESNTWSTGQEGMHPKLVAEQCTKAQLYLTRLLEMLRSSERQNTVSGSADSRRRGHPPDPVVSQIRNVLKRIREEARSHGSSLTNKKLCEQLDANKTPLPPGASWNRWGRWSRAYAEEERRAVDRWLSGS
jgi:hypothetical protein